MTELGLPQIDSQLWYSYVAPAGTPADVVAKLGDGMEKVVRSATFNERFGPLAFQANVTRGQPLSQFINSTAERFRTLIVENNIRVTE
jgi:tripartite-type tricarboxylate transporter receptor subunit TctC